MMRERYASRDACRQPERIGPPLISIEGACAPFAGRLFENLAI
jgi:hypothetical protein